MGAFVVLKKSRAEAACRDPGARERALDTVAALVLKAGDRPARLAMARRVIRFGAMAMGHMVGHVQVAAHLQALAGEVLADLAAEQDRAAQ